MPKRAASVSNFLPAPRIRQSGVLVCSPLLSPLSLTSPLLSFFPSPPPDSSLSTSGSRRGAPSSGPEYLLQKRRRAGRRGSEQPEGQHSRLRIRRQSKDSLEVSPSPFPSPPNTYATFEEHKALVIYFSWNI